MKSDQTTEPDVGSAPHSTVRAARKQLDPDTVKSEYRKWKHNAPFLYDVVVAHALEWPSLTCQWMPSMYSADGTQSERIERLILGTHTSDEQNHLVLASVNFGPFSDPYLYVQDPFGIAETMGPAPTDRSETLDNTELGGFSPALQNRVHIDMKIKHEGEVNRARYMPQNPCVIATKSPTADVFVFDLTRHVPGSANEEPGPQLRLKGHTKEGYGLSWNPGISGYVLSASDDHTVCMWNVNRCPAKQSVLQAQSIYRGHSSVVEDVCWHWSQPFLFGSVGDDFRLMVWDIRCHNLERAGQSIQAHRSEVQWSHCNETILASAGTDRQVIVWDISRIGEDKLPPKSGFSGPMPRPDEGPSEMVFIHSGHTAKISDFCWHPNIPWLVTSVSEDNIMQSWRVAEEIYEDELFCKMQDDFADSRRLLPCISPKAYHKG